ncbi:MAG: biopolymer transporter ExbD [Gammaproteobacteria bacterium]|nr:MAG: biopolymer transporter ExbD [Gammaproteobacteria bacterium]
MKESRRAKRMQRHHARRADKNAALNMVSLMDIFTILVFFLLVSAANTDILPKPKNIKLPRSTAEQLPKENLVIMLGDNSILLQGKKIADVNSTISASTNVIMPLYDELRRLSNQTGDASERKEIIEKGVTIMGDKEIPYILLKRIMLTCASAKYSNISFAVSRKAVEQS